LSPSAASSSRNVAFSGPCRSRSGELATESAVASAATEERVDRHDAVGGDDEGVEIGGREPVGVLLPDPPGRLDGRDERFGASPST
jgi:hypothetical protein